ncbi:unnamed protein product [Chondrus crispus]|uniref:AMP-dependent synthetase/ligase domain-containing protein n=1 Tax=Chondrus crispus TaxID=2769 RepID=R7Q5H6_CHOCR|nr:unnamed protein product [Chondrus crispus]CDF33083.1 unnamed protein product [Chondrus crispus]|eukprot:XP_005712886.1 unnamed protein product [Chondrus crispus]
MPFSPSSTLIQPSHPALQTLSPSDRHLFCKYASGPQQSPAFPTVLAAFEQMETTHPHALAATEVLEDGQLSDDANITYAQLNAQANKLAFLMQERGVSNGDAVCLFLKRSVQMIVGIIASLKVGACYVPQHVGLAPDTQLLNVADATSAKVVLTMDELQEKLPEFPPHVSVIPIGSVMRDAKLPTAEPSLSRAVRPSDRCYIIFTSGTTGAPKGVQVTHANVANVLLTSPMDLGMAPGVRVGQILSIAFDMGAWEILGCLSHGATLMTHVKTVAVAGEPCPRGLAATWGKFATFYNSCGPTETTIVNTAKRFDPESTVLTIGKPTPNNTVYVLDPETLEPCKIGEVGEMWAGGECVSAGYLNKPGLTAERYLVDPFINGVNSFMYKTGDLGRWDANGELEHYGRVDDQVKVKGFRVELDGVSAMAETAHGVEKAVVLKIGTELVAFVTPEYAKTEAVKEAVGIKLPYYCVPSRVVGMGALPKTGNGKVDKRALKEMDARKVLQPMLTRRSSSRVSHVRSTLRTLRVL